MELDSARGLKQELQAELVATQPMVAYAYTVDSDRFAGATAGAIAPEVLVDGLASLHRSSILRREQRLTLPTLTPALGLARTERGFALAVRVQAPVAATHTLVDYFTQRAHGEVHVRIVHNAMTYAVDLRAKQRPVLGGASVGHPSVEAGSVCCFVRTASGATELLSANHVLAAANAGRVGDPVLQPGRFDKGRLPYDRIGGLTAMVPLVLGQPNRVDAALCSLDAGVTPVLSPGRAVADAAKIADTTDVRKTGRTTATTDGRIQVIELDGIVLDVPGLGSVEYDGLVEMEGDGHPFAEPGDSGALVTDRAEELCVAMVVGGDGGDLVWGTPLETVLGSLEVSFAG